MFVSQTKRGEGETNEDCTVKFNSRFYVYVRSEKLPSRRLLITNVEKVTGNASRMTSGAVARHPSSAFRKRRNATVIWTVETAGTRRNARTMRSQPAGWISSGVIPRSVALNNQPDVITRTTVEIIATRRIAVRLTLASNVRLFQVAEFLFFFLFI